MDEERGMRLNTMFEVRMREIEVDREQIAARRATAQALSVEQVNGAVQEQNRILQRGLRASEKLGKQHRTEVCRRFGVWYVSKVI